MNAFTVAFFAFTCVVALVFVTLGVRLIRTGREAGSLAERCLGAGILLTPVGLVAIQLGVLLQENLYQAAGATLGVAGMTLVMLFTYLTFRPGEPAFRALLIVDVVLLWVGLADQARLGFGTGQASAILMGARVLGHAWGALEALRYRRMVGKQLLLGLGDPVVANRFSLFVGWFSVLALGELSMLATALGGDAFGDVYFILQRVAPGLGAIAVVLMWLIFWPPAWYLASVERRFAAADGGEPT